MPVVHRKVSLTCCCLSRSPCHSIASTHISLRSLNSSIYAVTHVCWGLRCNTRLLCSHIDDQVWAAAWLFLATREEQYLELALSLLPAAVQELDASYVTSRYILPAALALLSGHTSNVTLHKHLQAVLYDWICRNTVKYTPLGRAFHPEASRCSVGPWNNRNTGVLVVRQLLDTSSGDQGTGLLKI